MTDYQAETAALRAKWITSDDEARIKGDVKQKAFSFDSEQEIASRGEGKVRRVARHMQDLGRELSLALLRGVRRLGEGCFDRLRLPQVPWNTDPHDLLTQVRSLVASRLAELEQEWAEDSETGSMQPWQIETAALVRRWNGEPAYTFYRFDAHCVATAEEAARCAVADILDGSEDGRSIADQVQDAAEKFLKDWQAGK